jgi:hypothetical protein
VSDVGGSCGTCSKLAVVLAAALVGRILGLQLPLLGRGQVLLIELLRGPGRLDITCTEEYHIAYSIRWCW